MGKLNVPMYVRLALEHLDVRELARTAVVCREWRECAEQTLWFKVLKSGVFA